ncbi:MAG: LuxR family transcriptional regulator [Betaproteobacteria bacterium]
MLTRLEPKISAPIVPADIDILLQPLIAAAASGSSLEAAMEAILQNLGFDSFLYAMTTDPRPNRESRSYCWTTLPREWVQEYDKNAYIEVDPRITESRGHTSPLVWDSATIVATPRAARFLDHAAQYGICSGVAIPISDGSDARIGIMFNSSISPVDPVRREMIMQELGILMVIGTRFHDVFMARVIARGVVPFHQGAPLSTRERQCLRLAAHGMTSPDIGFKLGITERTANFHFSNIISKLGVLNRQEAVAKAISQGTIRLEP